MGRTGVVRDGGQGCAAQIPENSGTDGPTSLIDHLQCKDIKVPSVRAAWQKMHKRWLGFWVQNGEYRMGTCFSLIGPSTSLSSTTTLLVEVAK